MCLNFVRTISSRCTTYDRIIVLSLLGMYRFVVKAALTVTATVGLAELATRPSFKDALQDFKSNIGSLFSYSDEFEDFSRWGNIEKITITAKAKALANDSEVSLNLEEIAIERRNEIMKYGYPTMDNIKQFNDHVLAYSNVHKGPLWVCEHLTDYNINLNKSVNRSQSKFVSDSTNFPFL